MEHYFNVQVAQQFGIEEAIIIHNLFYWISKNAANEENMFEGLYWTYNSIKAYSALFPYLSETKVKRVFKSLEEKGIIVKGNFSDDKWVRTNWYSFPLDTLNYLQNVGYDVHWVKANQCIGSKCTNGEVQNDPMILINNTDSKKDNKTKENTKVLKKDLFEECWVAYRRKGIKKRAEEQWNKLKESEMDMVMPHIKAYVSSREIQYQKDFERYLRDRVFMEVVYNGNNLVYDPTKSAGSDATNQAYSPLCGGMLNWNEYYKCYMYTGIWYGGIVDGYTDDNRPDGAEITLNNGRGRIQWDAKSKEWRKKI